MLATAQTGPRRTEHPDPASCLPLATHRQRVLHCQLRCPATRRFAARSSGLASDQAFPYGAGDENRTRTISLGMSVAAWHDQDHRRSAVVLTGPPVTVNHRGRPTYRARRPASRPQHHGASSCRAGPVYEHGFELSRVFDDPLLANYWPRGQCESLAQVTRSMTVIQSR
jgi:hypothetical protein